MNYTIPVRSSPSWVS